MTPPVLVAAIYVPVSVWLCWRGIVAGVPPAGVAGLFAIGALIWSWPAAWLHPMR